MVGAQDWGQCFTFEGQTYSLGKAFTTAGFSLADEHTAGFEVMQYCALTFVSFLDPTQRIDSLTKQTTVKAYQATLQQHNIQLDYYDENPVKPYLCG